MKDVLPASEEYAMAKKDRTIVGSPLIPQMIHDLDALGTLSPMDVPPAGAWTDTFRIWACHGYRESGNENVGFLKLQRTPAQSDGVFTLNVLQKIQNDAGIAHWLDAQIQCRTDRVATPIKWRLKSTFHDPAGRTVHELGTEQTGRVRDRTIETQTRGKTRTIKAARPVTGDWCLLEAVQRMPCEETDPVRMDVLKEMDLLQTDHRIAYIGLESVVRQGADMPLYRFHQWGRGMLPYDYWLDQNHRLQVFVTLSIAYIRDDNAEESLD